MALHREDTLRRSKTAERALRRAIRGDGGASNSYVGAEIGTRRMDGPTRENDRGQRRVRAAVDGKFDIRRQQFSILVDSGADARAGGMALRGGHHIFRAIVNELHRKS